MKILAIDTSSEACSAALCIQDAIISRYEIAPRLHAELILPMVDQLLKQAEISLQQLDAIAYGCGPGAFTGIRVATGVAQGLSYACDKPVIPVSSLAALAQSIAVQHTFIIPAFDARMGEVYCGVYEVNSDGLVTTVQDEVVIKPEDFLYQLGQPCFGIGSGWASYPEELNLGIGNNLLQGYEADRFPSAEYILPLAKQAFKLNRLIEPHQATPTYLRNRVTG